MEVIERPAFHVRHPYWFRLRAETGVAAMGAAIIMLLLPYGIAAIMPSWRWLAGYVAVSALLLAFWVHGVWRATGLEAITVVYAGAVAVPVFSGALVRVATLAMEARGLHRRAGVVTIASAIIPFAVLAVFGLAK